MFLIKYAFKLHSLPYSSKYFFAVANKTVIPPAKFITPAQQQQKKQKIPSAYNMFVKQFNPVIKAAYPDESPTEILTRCSQYWKDPNFEPTTKQELADEYQRLRKEQGLTEKTPKRAPSAYNLFISKYVPQVKELYNLQGKEAMKKASELWKDQTYEPEDKEILKQQALALKEEFIQKYGEPQPVKQKRASNAYNLYTSQKMIEIKEQYPDEEGLQQINRCIEMWKDDTVDLELKQQCEEEAKKQKLIFDDIKQKEEKKEKRPPTAYHVFCAKYKLIVKKDQPELKGRDLVKRVNELWKDESYEVEDKLQIKAIAKQQFEAFKLEQAAKQQLEKQMQQPQQTEVAK